MTLKIIIRPDEDGGFVASVPALRGCHSQGDTREETLVNIREAIEGWLEVEQDKVAIVLPEEDVELLTV